MDASRHCLGCPDAHTLASPPRPHACCPIIARTPPTGTCPPSRASSSSSCHARTWPATVLSLPPCPPTCTCTAHLHPPSFALALPDAHTHRRTLSACPRPRPRPPDVHAHGSTIPSHNTYNTMKASQRSVSLPPANAWPICDVQ
ncbi:hypothetical protein OG21DRAFT_263373 [Imleria badia]|nr:hypothetical protein OG21DRAFT_263373 [Imleria badia]